MKETIVAIYDDIVMARQVVEDLVKADFPRDSISLITNDANNHYSRFLDEDYTPRDDAVTASEGAGFGAIAGGLVGVLAGLAALTIPGIGLVIVAGPVVAGLTGMLAGAVTGGIVGALVKTGVPEDDAPYYAEGIRRGATLISIETADTLHAEDIMNRYGSINIHERSNVWREGGWKGFDTDVAEVEQVTTNDTTKEGASVVEHATQPYSTHRPVQTPDAKTNGFHGSQQTIDDSSNQDVERSIKQAPPVILPVPDLDMTQSDADVTEQLPEIPPVVTALQADEYHDHAFDRIDDDAPDIDADTEYPFK